MPIKNLNGYNDCLCAASFLTTNDTQSHICLCILNGVLRLLNQIVRAIWKKWKTESDFFYYASNSSSSNIVRSKQNCNNCQTSLFYQVFEFISILFYFSFAWRVSHFPEKITS